MMLTIASTRPLPQQHKQQQQQQQHSQKQQLQQQVLVPGRRRRLLAAVGAAVLVGGGAIARPATATGIDSESFDALPTLQAPQALIDFTEARSRQNRQVLADADASFQSSDLLKTLQERTEANRDANKAELTERYCRRQAEMGVGDCGGLR